MAEHISKEYLDVAICSSAKTFKVLIRGINSSSDFCITTQGAIEFQDIMAKHNPARLIQIASDRGYFKLRWLDENSFVVQSRVGDVFILSEECTCELHYLLGLALARLAPSIASSFTNAANALDGLKEAVDKLPKEIFDDDTDGVKKRTNDNLRGVFA